jgi:DNA-binding MarR family transcriptional regulator
VKKSKIKRELAEEIDLLDSMISSLVDLLEQKGILTRDEWEKYLKEQIKIK